MNEILVQHVHSYLHMPVYWNADYLKFSLEVLILLWSVMLFVPIKIPMAASLCFRT